MVSPGASTGTAQQTAKSASAGPMLRLGMTRNSCMYGAPVTMALVPEMTIPPWVALDDVHVGVRVAC
jgi:hypothetical protein